MVVAGTWNVENLFRPSGDFGPANAATYEEKLTALAATITAHNPDILGLQEVGQPEALADLVDRLGGTWYTALSGHFDEDHPIRVAVIARHPVTVNADTATFPPQLAPVQVDDANTTPVTQMGRGALTVRVTPVPGTPVTVLVCHLKSKLLSYPSTRPGLTRFVPHDEGERARYAGYALNRRSAEAVTVRAATDTVLAAQPGGRLLVVGDLNDEPQAATTQILYGPPGSQLGTAGADRPDQGDTTRLWNLAPKIPAGQRYTRIYQGQPELIDHILANHSLLPTIQNVTAVHDHPLPSIGDNPASRRQASGSDHAPLFATLNL
jgi:endonuclease/exonuclease/phosphatase family metal-dependent hydrolase